MRSTSFQHTKQVGATFLPSAPRASGALKWIVVVLPIAYLWFRLFDNLRIEWGTNPQYSYGWVVPFLCIGLLLRRLNSSNVSVQLSKDNVSILAPWIFAGIAFLYLPTRLIEAATPEWRPIQWALGLQTVGLTLCTIYLNKGSTWQKNLAFPICFFLVAIPWPSLIEIPVIQSLTRVSTALAVETVGWFDIPALQHGNVIQVTTGTLGVEEACSGIRSFQTSLMISLFFGEFYRMGIWRRVLLIPAGFILAMAFNVCRISILTSLAANKGIQAIAEYHDPAGISITLICTAGLWGLAQLVKEREIQGTSSETPRYSSLGPQLARLSVLAIALIVWLASVELGVESWYRVRESHLKPTPSWTMDFPKDNPTFRPEPIDAKTENLLRYDEAAQDSWREPDGSLWQGFYCSWRPGRVAGYLAKRHTPEICLPAVGWKMVSGPQLTMMTINGVTLPVRSYVFETETGTMYVFHCRWEASVNEDFYVANDSSRWNLIRGIWTGRGNKGQKVLEFIVSGYADPEQAKAGLVRQLQNMIKVDKTGVPKQGSSMFVMGKRRG